MSGAKRVVNELQVVKQKVFLTNLILVVNLLGLPVFQGSSLAANGLIGSPAPYFTVQSGDDKELNLGMIGARSLLYFTRPKTLWRTTKGSRMN